jgi:hypothetical protein
MKKNTTEEDEESKRDIRIQGVCEEWDDIRLRGSGDSRIRGKLNDGFRMMALENDEDLSDVKNQ